MFCIGNSQFRGTNEITLFAFKFLPNFYNVDLEPLERDKKKIKEIKNIQILLEYRALAANED